MPAPTKKKTALLIIDMINKFDFPEGNDLLKGAVKAGQAIAALKKFFTGRDWPVIYVNDNFGHWKEDWKRTQKACARSKGAPLAKLLCPGEEDLFILKPKNSAFFETQLGSLLAEMEVKRVVITGVAANICVLYTANDAHSRGFEIIVPADAVASNTKRENDFALDQIQNVFKAKTPTSKSLMRSL